MAGAGLSEFFSSASSMSLLFSGRTTRAISSPSFKKIRVGQSLTPNVRPQSAAFAILNLHMREVCVIVHCRLDVGLSTLADPAPVGAEFDHHWARALVQLIPAQGFGCISVGVRHGVSLLGYPSGK
jgi:hypothetical protein